MAQPGRTSLQEGACVEFHQLIGARIGRVDSRSPPQPSSGHSTNSGQIHRTWIRHGLLLLAYGFAFTALRSFASKWGTYGLFSLWFPAAGLRFAVLWRAGARSSPFVAAAEYLVGYLSGTVVIQGNLLVGSIGVLGPGLAYGLTIGAVQAVSRRQPSDFDDSLQFATAAIVAPFTACVAALPWALPAAMRDGVLNGAEVTSALIVFSLGDLLGVLLIAPPLLALARSWEGRQRRYWSSIFSRERLQVVLFALVPAWSLVAAFYHFGRGLVLAPILLVNCWIGMRAGRPAAWLATVIAAGVVLPFSATVQAPHLRIEMHVMLACIAAGAFLAGSYSDAEARAVIEIRKRDRLLFQAERLKTLRGMSLALIHEISQPLTTIALEARGLRDNSRSEACPRAELAVASDLIAKKADELAEMIARLRSFGSSPSGDRTQVPVGDLLETALKLAADGADDGEVQLLVGTAPDISVWAAPIEMRQAIFNLLRNAIQASPRGGEVRISWVIDPTEVVLTIGSNTRATPVTGAACHRPRSKFSGYSPAHCRQWTE